jgi:signal transduction histidine kinase
MLNYESIVSNLVENALKYGGDQAIEVKLSSQNSKFTLVVSDYGMGIPNELKARVFEKFYRAENEETRTKKGTGLGLYIVKQLVNLSGGKIHIEDNAPTGSKFIVELPL